MAELLARYSVREKFIVLIGILILVGMAVHALVIEPYHQRVASVEEAIVQGREDLQWMSSAVQGLGSKGGIIKNSQSFNGTLANLIDQTVKQQQLNSFLSQMTPRGEDEIRVRFSAIPFEKFITFIAELKDRGLNVKDLRINAGDNPAQVDSSLVLNKG